MFWRRKPVVDLEDIKEARAAIDRANQSIAETQEREPEVNQLVIEMKKADPFGAGLIQAMGSRHK